MRDTEKAIRILVEAQQKCEDLYPQENEPTRTVPPQAEGPQETEPQ